MSETEQTLTGREREVLNELLWTNRLSSHPLKWCRPMDVGGGNSSFHSATLSALSRKGLVQSKQRGTDDPPDGENGPAPRHRQRGSKVYRITDAGRAALGAK